jgi:two-component sensor histidine kinase
MLFASLIELALFAFVLANHVQMLYKEKLESQIQLSKVQANQNKYLQLQVAKQTKSLNFLLKELHHRVKNNFQFITGFIWAQKQQNTSSETQIALEQINDRVFSISALHEFLSIDGSEELNLEKYMNTILESFQQNHPEIHYNYQIHPLNLDYETSITLGLILNELLTNSAKYAFLNIQNPRIDVKCYAENNLYYFQYLDNGIGFDINTLEEHTGFGYAFIQEVISKLPNHTYKIEGDNNFKFILSFLPLSKENHHVR